MAVVSHYDVLGVPSDADAAAIRKGYLRASLRYHPDKNPGREEEAKANFVAVGQAYSILSDPVKRAAYDRELAAGRFRANRQRTKNYEAAGASGGGVHQRQDYCDEQGDKDFDWFMGQFDETVSGMTEEEVNVAMGAAAVVGSIIGSIIGANATRGKNSFLTSAASMVGSAMASHAASELVKTVHDDSKQRVIETEERKAAIARGEAVPEYSARESRERVFQDAGRAFQRVAGAAVAPNARSSGMNSYAGNATTGNNGNNSGRFSWQQAAKLACMAAEACAEMKSQSTKR
ncbi:hypothetical protein ACHAWF_015088 [Thalassiosira exigua]